MQRYQVYLRPQSVKIIDAYKEKVGTSRSEVIRYLVDSAAQNLVRALAKSGKKTLEGPLDSIIGVIHNKGDETTFGSSSVDQIYLKD